jgi:thioredoxin-like negative regulator of GroEL
VTSEGKNDTEAWVKQHGAEYAYAYDKGGKLSSYFGIPGLPHAVLIDASGTVIWKGHPGEFDPKLIEQAIQGALTKPLWEWSKAAGGVKAALLKRDYKTALDGASKLAAADDGPSIAGALQAMVKSRVDAMQAAYAQGDYLFADNESKLLSKQLVGLPELEAANKMIADLTANKDAAAVIKVQKQIAKLREASKSKEIDGAIEDLKKIAKTPPNPFVGAEASKLIDQLRAKKSANK